MKGKILSILDTTKKKAGFALLCGALVTTIGAGTTFASSSRAPLLSKIDNGVRSYSTDGGKTWSEKAPDGVTETRSKDGKFIITNGIPPEGSAKKGVLCRVENGVRSYSTDGGKTWSEEAPDGTIIGEYGKIGIMEGTPPEGAEGMGLLCREENGVISYSIDGGKTWSENVPDGVTINEDGSITYNGNTLPPLPLLGTGDCNLTIMEGTPPEGAEGIGLLCREENGVRNYSTDGGKTWNENVPDGVIINEDGSITYNGNTLPPLPPLDAKDSNLIIMKGAAPEGAEGMGFMIRMVNGVRSYSTDGGKTWSENVPDGVIINEDGSITYNGNTLPPLPPLKTLSSF